MNTLLSSNWNLPQKVLFRFFFCYFVLYICSPVFNPLWQMVIPWVGHNLFNFTDELSLPKGGSGDTSFSYVQFFLRFCAAIFAMGIWSALDKKERSYKNLLWYFTTTLRYYLAFFMLLYGFSKIFTNQYSELSLFDLIKPYGNSSPMGLLWNFMEYSDSYTIFSGTMEFIGGIFLLFRKTTRLGALICFGVMLQVFMLNMSYDVPVKLFSAHLMLIAILIIIPDIKNFINFYILNRSTSPITIKPYFKKKAFNTVGRILKTILLIGGVIILITMEIKQKKAYGKKSPLPPLYGIYDVQYFILNNDTLPSLVTDTLRWKQLVVDKWYSGIVAMNDKIEYVENKTDTVKKSIQFTSYRDSTLVYNLNFIPQDSLLMLKGNFGNRLLKINLKKKKLDDFLLLNRKFHWISEVPFNR
ncbi:DoxX family protein [Sinomicrobium sp. M5D2P17]